MQIFLHMNLIYFPSCIVYMLNWASSYKDLTSWQNASLYCCINFLNDYVDAEGVHCSLLHLSNY